jgi:1-acyl-sn-glycerol-3-phosphate acyltransferase
MTRLRASAPAGAGPGATLHALVVPLAWLLLQLQLVLLGVMSLAFNLAAFVLYWVLPRRLGRRLGRAGIAHGYALYWALIRPLGFLRLDASALDTLRDERGLVIVANHPSLLDAMLLVSRLPRSFCVMKSSLMRNPFLATGAQLAHYIPNDSAHTMVRRAVAELREGGQLVMFPEGTRTTRPPLDPFTASFTLIAKHAVAPVQTVFIDTDSPYLGKGWPLWRLPPLPIRFSVRLGRRFAPRADHEALMREIETYLGEGLGARAGEAGTARPPAAL